MKQIVAGLVVWGALFAWPGAAAWASEPQVRRAFERGQRAFQRRQYGKALSQWKRGIQAAKGLALPGQIEWLPRLHYASARAHARRRQKKAALQSLKSAINAGFWELRKIGKVRDFRRLGKGVKPLLRALQKDQHELAWLRAELEILSLEAMAIDAEETWRIDREPIRTYFLPPPSHRPACGAAKAWRRLLKYKQKQLRRRLYKKYAHRLRRKKAPARLRDPFAVSGFTGAALRRMRVRRSRKLARKAFELRKKAALLRRYRPSSPKLKKGLHPLRWLPASWRWRMYLVQSRQRLKGSIVWRKAGSYYLGISQFRHRGTNTLLGIALHYLPSKGYAMVFFQKGGCAWAAGPSQPLRARQKKMLWQLGARLRQIWDWSASRIQVRQYARNSQHNWNLHSTTTWRKR